MNAAAHASHSVAPTHAFQGAMALAGSFPLQLLLTLLASAVWAPPQIISDACVMAASTSVRPGGRGVVVLVLTAWHRLGLCPWGRHA